MLANVGIATAAVSRVTPLLFNGANHVRVAVPAFQRTFATAKPVRSNAARNFSRGVKTLAVEKVALCDNEFLKTASTGRLSDRFSEQARQVQNLLVREGRLNPASVPEEVKWFYDTLGFNEFYFETTPVETIAKHIVSLQAARILADASGNTFDIKLSQQNAKDAFFVAPSMPGVPESPCYDVEHKIESMYLGEGYEGNQTDNHWRMQSYQSAEMGAGSKDRIRMYMLEKPEFANAKVDANETDINKIGSTQFLATATDKSKELHRQIIEKVVQRPGGLGVQISMVRSTEGDTIRLICAYRRGTTHSFMTSAMDAYQTHNLHSTRKFVEQFANGVVVSTFYLKCSDGNVSKLEERVMSAAEDISLRYVLPRSELADMNRERHLKLNTAELSYAHCAFKFAFQFLNRTGEEYQSLAKALNNDPAMSAQLFKLKSRLKALTYTESSILNAIANNPAMVKTLYQEFAQLHCPEVQGEQSKLADVKALIKKQVDTPHDQTVFDIFHEFNTHIMRTNFYRKNKGAIAFRMNPDVFSRIDYPDKLYGQYYVVGSEFRGFHARFADVARGGIRVVRSANNAAYLHNSISIFDENYALAHTQHRKNKDIPEGGSKGTILLNMQSQGKGKIAFKKYVDALLDICLPNNEMVDRLGKEEILYLGPDEGTAELMEWAAFHAKARGFKFWKAYTTGKPQSLGGIPHDLYGMTTHSVQVYVNGIYRKLALDERKVTKFQTGGPDGDLGSNSIKMSCDKTTAIVDGSGVLYDPEGLNREELARLVERREMVKHFDRSKLGSKGFLVLIEDRDVKLPDGTVVANGMQFRNEFHLNPLSSADIFVPNGGRPQSINSANLHMCFDKKTNKPRWKYLVEGANLFVTQEARLELEKAGVVLFKDASANKGGVTSSSHEVQAALALSDDEYDRLMRKKGDKVSDFYHAYATEVTRRIDSNAEAEFEGLWREHARTGIPRSILSDKLSNKIVRLQYDIMTSNLYDDHALRAKVMEKAIPKMLLDFVGLDKLEKRVPESYLKAIFGAYLASRYVYATGLDGGDLGFYDYIRKSFA